MYACVEFVCVTCMFIRAHTCMQLQTNMHAILCVCVCACSQNACTIQVTEEELRNKEAKGTNMYGEKLEGPAAEFRRKKLANQVCMLSAFRTVCLCMHVDF